MTDEPTGEAEKNPLLRPLHESAGRSRPRNRKLEEMILALGLRYHPSSSDMVQQHKAKLAALVEDLDTIPLGPLEKAIDHWKRTSAFLPKASDLIHLAANFARSGAIGDPNKRLDQAAKRNAEMDNDPKARQDIRWVYDGAQLTLVPIDEYHRRKDNG